MQRARQQVRFINQIGSVSKSSDVFFCEFLSYWTGDENQKNVEIQLLAAITPDACVDLISKLNDYSLCDDQKLVKESDIGFNWENAVLLKRVFE